MPLYEFRCLTCGSFEEWRCLAEFSKPAKCPRCQTVGSRVFTPPNLVRTPAAIRKARFLEEKSANEPEVVVRRPRQEEPPQRPKPYVTGSRPWMVGG